MTATNIFEKNISNSHLGVSQVIPPSYHLIVIIFSTKPTTIVGISPIIASIPPIIKPYTIINGKKLVITPTIPRKMPKKTRVILPYKAKQIPEKKKNHQFQPPKLQAPVTCLQGLGRKHAALLSSLGPKTVSAARRERLQPAWRVAR